MSDAWGGSWGTSWGTSWTPSGVTPPETVVGGFYDEPKRKEHQPNVDRAALRAMLEDAFDGKRPAPIAEVVAQHRLPKSAPREAYGVDWSALLDNVDAQLKVLRAHQQRLESQRHREAHAAEVRAMVERIEARRPIRRRLRRVAVRLLLSGAR
jgi:hypothetical protein